MFAVIYTILIPALFLSALLTGGKKQAKEFSEQKATYAKVDTTNMVFVKGGTYSRGSMQFANEMPVHEVIVSDFYIDKYEVTVADYKKYCDAVGIDMPKEPDWGYKGKENYPIVNVTYEEAKKYAEWCGKRLPTEAEWEYAAKGGIKSQNYVYSGANYPEAVAWFDLNSPNSPQPVGLKKPNELGIYDMSGNVWEWCSDFYADYPKNTKEVLKNPEGPASGLNRVLRGGSWFGSKGNLRVANRYYHPPAYGGTLIGFRLVADAVK
jgi:formylglycine-generating enzyme required for sulfatase activity